MTRHPATVTAAGPDPPVIDLRGVGVSYRGQRPLREPGLRSARHRRCDLPPPALSGVDLTVRQGEMVALTGRTTSGSSTLLHVVGLLVRPTTGTYLLNGINTARLGDRDRSALRGKQIGLVFQPPRLIPERSALDNVALPLLYAAAPGAVRRRLAFACLERIGLASKAHRPAAELSAGERQLVAIARALVTMPSLLICDDPTASLDSHQGAQLIAWLTALRSDGRTILVATRDQLAAAHSSRCVSFDEPRATPAGAQR